MGLAALVDRRRVLWRRDRDLRPILEHLATARTGEFVPSVVDVPSEAVVGRRARRRAVEDVGDEVPVGAVLLLEREDEGVLFRSPVEGRCASCGVGDGRGFREDLDGGRILGLASRE
jgi:hypothetical protein